MLNRTCFLTIFVNLQKRLESAVLASQCKFSVKAIIYVLINQIKKVSFIGGGGILPIYDSLEI